MKFDRFRILAIIPHHPTKHPLHQKTRDTADNDGANDPQDHLGTFVPMNRLRPPQCKTAAEQGKNKACCCGNWHTVSGKGIKKHSVGEVNTDIDTDGRIDSRQGFRIEYAFAGGFHHWRRCHGTNDYGSASDPNRLVPGHHACAKDGIDDVGGVVSSDFHRVPDQHDQRNRADNVMK
jgi:hypothetical protein